MKRLFKICFLILAIPLMGVAQNTGAVDGIGGVSNPFSVLGLGAAPLSMGSAYVSISDDPTAMFWNPAGLDHIDQKNITLFHSSLIEGILFDYAGFVYPTLNVGTIGLGFARIGVTDINLWDEYNQPNGTANYSIEEIYISYGKKMPMNLSMGVTAKIDRQSSNARDNLNTSGFGIDAGLLWRNKVGSSLLSGWSLGLTYLNAIQPKLKLGDGVDTYPGEYRVGLSKIIPLGLTNALQVAVDYHKNNEMPSSIHAGLRYSFKNFTKIAVGYDESSITMGAGIKYKSFQLDYNFGNPSYQSEFSALHRFSFTFKFGYTRDELFQIAEQKRIERERELVEKTREEERTKFVDQHLKQADEFFKNNSFLDAYVEYQQVLSMDPFNKRAKVMLDSADQKIKAELATREKQAVSQAVDKALAEENQSFVQSHYERGRLLLDKKRFTEALMEFNLALTKDPNNKLVKNAITTAKNRLNIEIRRLMNTGREQFSQGNFAEALQVLNEASILAPDDKNLKREIETLSTRIKVQQYIQEGLIYFDLGEYDKALNSFSEAGKLDPANQIVKNYLDKSRTSVNTSMQKMDPESERLYLEGVEAYLVGRYNDALKIWLALKEKYPYNKKVLDAIQRAQDLIKRQNK